MLLPTIFLINRVAWGHSNSIQDLKGKDLDDKTLQLKNLKLVFFLSKS